MYYIYCMIQYNDMLNDQTFAHNIRVQICNGGGQNKKCTLI